jgi:hypothetical protein
VNQLMKHLVAAIACTVLAIPHLVAAQTSISPGEARAIAKEAYTYGFPLVDNYRVEYAYFVDHENPEFKAPWNEITNIPRVFTPADTAVQTPNSDTPYSWLGLDLRTEPIVLTLPPIEKDRYISVQFTDAYTFNFDYVGTRTTGNDGGSFLIVGPNWKGQAPKGVKNKSSTSRPESSARRNPQPRSTEIIAKSRRKRRSSPAAV